MTDPLEPAILSVAGGAAVALGSCGNDWSALASFQDPHSTIKLVPAPPIDWQRWLCEVYGVGEQCSLEASELGRRLRWAAGDWTALGVIQPLIVRFIEFSTPQFAWIEEAVPVPGYEAEVQPVLDQALRKWAWFIDQQALLHHLVGRERARLRRVSDS